MTSTSVGLRSGPLTWLDRQSATLLVVTVAAIAWVVLFYGHVVGGPLDHGVAHGTVDPAHGSHGSHDHAPPARAAGPSVLGPVLTGSAAWGVMVVAMMLPPALPLFTLLRRLLASRPRRTLLLVLALAVFTVAWTAVGIVLVGADVLVGSVTEAWEPRQQVLLGAVLVLAGVYQFTPLKDACLRACRSPRSFALAHWHGRRPGVEASRLTFAYALTCIGCCWALMAICLVVGAVALPAMVLLAVVMAAERLVPWGRRRGRHRHRHPGEPARSQLLAQPPRASSSRTAPAGSRPGQPGGRGRHPRRRRGRRAQPGHHRRAARAPHLPVVLPARGHLARQRPRRHRRLGERQQRPRALRRPRHRATRGYLAGPGDGRDSHRHTLGRRRGRRRHRPRRAARHPGAPRLRRLPPRRRPAQLPRVHRLPARRARHPLTPAPRPRRARRHAVQLPRRADAQQDPPRAAAHGGRHRPGAGLRATGHRLVRRPLRAERRAHRGVLDRPDPGG